MHVRKPVLCVVLIEVLSCTAYWGGSPSTAGRQELALRGVGCRDAHYMLENSIPLSCNDGLNTVMSYLPNNVTTIPDLRDLCQTYCLYPLRQAAADCEDIRTKEEVVRGLCSKYRARRCFSLVTSETSLNLVHYCGNILNETQSQQHCPGNCSQALSEARERLGCCINAVFNTTALQPYYSFSSDWVWQQCNQTLPQVCTNSAQRPWNPVMISAGILLVALHI